MSLVSFIVSTSTFFIEFPLHHYKYKWFAERSSSAKYKFTISKNNLLGDGELNALGGLADSSASGVTHLLLGQHQFESLVVIQALLGVGGGDLLRPLGLGPLGHDAVSGERLLQDLLRASTLDLALQAGEAQPLDGHHLTLDAGLRAGDDDLGEVLHVDDDDHLSLQRSVSDQGQSARFDEPLENGGSATGRHLSFSFDTL